MFNFFTKGEYLTENGINLEIDAISKNQKKYQTGKFLNV